MNEALSERGAERGVGRGARAEQRGHSLRGSNLFAEIPGDSFEWGLVESN